MFKLLININQKLYKTQFLQSKTNFSKMQKKPQKQKIQQNQQEEQKQQIPYSIYENKGKLYIQIKAKPNSKISQVSSISDDCVDVNIAAPPKDGEANEELIQLFSSLLNIKKSSLQLDKGGKSKSKLLEINDSEYKTASELYEALKEAIQQ
ncbi:hypothetical protein IMG5_013830 [Ichthyophthirius multifiliis]|uniref:Uncharacterized protein n=1 Tax=Ichthyophthirius multifiliis TaxID=5932 RepID=G0QK74_ICHMU|nr:hypothetical protein IMG5_013830 [Ichthyophthirius multifiliis]EGR34382.1 hypothetical protein IMG5_013830 [Ichthyophthirius multifiliis]|eukprot:XP_004039686.1 hypothetical protein IMG5_013830 [Ichthyophthirius multifiliis]